MSKEKEIWRTYPEFDFIQGSNLGRVRTIDRVVTRKDGRKQSVKGRMLKPHLNRDGYLQVHFRVNGKSVNLKVHRIIAKCFLSNPDSFPQVNHRDCDRANNCVDNLEWCTHQYNNEYREKYGTALNRPVYAVDLETQEILYFESQSEASRKLGLSVSRVNSVVKGNQSQTGGFWFTEDRNEISVKKLDEIKANMRCQVGVIAVNLKTLEVLRFESQKEAEQELGIANSNINAVLKGRYKQAGGYWFTMNENEITKEKLDEIKDGMLHRGDIIAVNLETQKVLRFKSQREAGRELGISHGNIASVIKGHRNHTRGYWFTYANENTVEATRAKFGDEVANKVAELMGKKVA